MQIYTISVKQFGNNNMGYNGSCPLTQLFHFSQGLAKGNKQISTNYSRKTISAFFPFLFNMGQAITMLAALHITTQTSTCFSFPYVLEINFLTCEYILEEGRRRL